MLYDCLGGWSDVATSQAARAGRKEGKEGKSTKGAFTN